MSDAPIAAVKERPILFSAPMVRAILEGRKTQTRRVVKPQPPEYIDRLHGNDLRGRAPYECLDAEYGRSIGYGFQDDEDRFYAAKHGMPGDRLWVRETHAFNGNRDAEEYQAKPAIWPPDRVGELVGPFVWYKATDEKLHDQQLGPSKWRPSIHMPRWASRLTLEITNVRVERLQDISEADAKAEGIEASQAVEMKDGSPCFTLPFEQLWERINGCDSWAANPWVWVYEFACLEQT